MDDGVVPGTGQRRARQQPDHSGHEKPEIAGEQASRHVSHQSGGTHGTPRDIMIDQPGDQTEQSQPGQGKSQLGPQQRRSGGAEQRACRHQKHPFLSGRHPGHPGQFEAFPGDRQHHENDQPRKEDWDLDRPQPEHGRTGGRHRAAGLGEEGRAGLASPESGIEPDQSEAPDEKQGLAESQVEG